MDRLKMQTNPLISLCKYPLQKVILIDTLVFTMLCGTYWTIVKIAISFCPYQLLHGVDSIFLIECEIPSLKLAIELLRETFELEERLVNLDHLDEQCRHALVDLEINKYRVKVQHDKSVCPQIFSEGDLVLLYDQASELLGEGKFNPM